MLFQFSEEQLMIKQAARDFAVNECLPGVIERDELQKFPKEQVLKLADLGFLGMMVDPKYGGAGMDTVSYVLAMEEISKIDASVSVVMSVNNSLVCFGLQEYGSEEQKQKYLKRLAAGEIIGAFCLSEPEAGSDATSQHTTAEDKGDHYLVNGTKNWITNGPQSDTLILFAMTDPAKKAKGVSAFIVETRFPGVEIGKDENKLGIRASGTCTISFNNVKVPVGNRIGGEGEVKLQIGIHTSVRRDGPAAGPNKVAAAAPTRAGASRSCRPDTPCRSTPDTQPARGCGSPCRRSASPRRGNGGGRTRRLG